MKNAISTVIPNVPVSEGDKHYSLTEYIKHYREKQGLPADIGARVLNISEADYVLLEQGKFPITGEMLLLLIKIYNMPRRLKNIILNPDRPELAKIITELRLKAGRTQADTAATLKIAQQTYAGYETGRNLPDINTLIRIADLYDVSLDHLTGRYVKQN